MSHKSINDLWKEYKPEYRNLFRLGLPVLVTQIGIIIVNFADTIMVGGYGTDELAAAAFVNSLFVLPTVMQIGFASGITPLVGALFSRGENERVGTTFRGGLQVNLLVSLVFTVFMGALYFFLDSFGQPTEIMPLVRTYYLIVLSTLLPMAVFNSCQQTANGVTDTATPMWMILAANVVNIVGNYALIYGHLGLPELGLTGAGLSTMTARYVGMAGILSFMFLSRHYRPYLTGFHRTVVDPGSVRRQVWVTSYPLMFQSGIECFLWSFGTIVSGWFGKIQLAAYQVVNTMSQLGFMTYMSFGIATSIRVANFTGLRDMTGVRRITSAGLRLNLLLATLASLIFIFGGRHLLGVFTPDAEVVGAALALIPPMVLYQYADAYQLTFVNALRGTSHVRPLLWISIVSYLIAGVPFLLLLACGFGLGSLGVYYSFSGALIIASILLRRSFRKVRIG